MAEVAKMKLVASSSRKMNGFEATTGNMNWSNSTENWYESFPMTEWFDNIKKWFQELSEKGIFRDILIGVGAVLLLVAVSICICFCVNIIITAICLMARFILTFCQNLVMGIVQALRFIFRCCVGLVTAIFRAIRFVLGCCGPPVGKLMKAPGQAGKFILRSVFEADPRGYFISLRGK